MTTKAKNMVARWGVAETAYTVTTHTSDPPVITKWKVCGVRSGFTKGGIYRSRRPAFRYRCARPGEEGVFLEDALHTYDEAKLLWQQAITELIETHQSEERHLRQLMSKGPKVRE